MRTEPPWSAPSAMATSPAATAAALPLDEPPGAWVGRRGVRTGPKAAVWPPEEKDAEAYETAAEHFQELPTFARIELFQTALHELEMDMKRVEGIADLMRDARHHLRERAAAVDFLLRLHPFRAGENVGLHIGRRREPLAERQRDVQQDAKGGRGRGVADAQIGFARE